MIASPNDMIELETLIYDAFNLLQQAADMVETDEDHRKLIRIRNIIQSKILIHKPYVLTEWLKSQAARAWEEIEKYEDLEDAGSY